MATPRAYDFYESYDKRYFWNYNICMDFIYQQVNQQWIVPIIQGSVNHSLSNFCGSDLDIYIISRRRHLMAGTRYNARGLDDEGNVANYVESEQIVTYGKHLFALTQIRGSVPLFWVQKGISQNTSLKRSAEFTIKVFESHINDLVDDYKLILFINLLQRARSYEDNLTKGLEKQF